MKNFLNTIAITIIPAALFAQGQTSYQCTMDEMTRRVEIMHETGVTVPCEVHYYKDTEAPGESQVLWRAMNEEGFCEAKTTEFVARLTSMGWNCGMPATVPSEAIETDNSEPEMTDDTDTLAPAEEIELPDSEAETEPH